MMLACTWCWRWLESRVTSDGIVCNKGRHASTELPFQAPHPAIYRLDGLQAQWHCSAFFTVYHAQLWKPPHIWKHFFYCVPCTAPVSLYTMHSFDSLHVFESMMMCIRRLVHIYRAAASAGPAFCLPFTVLNLNLRTRWHGYTSTEQPLQQDPRPVCHSLHRWPYPVHAGAPGGTRPTRFGCRGCGGPATKDEGGRGKSMWCTWMNGRKKMPRQWDTLNQDTHESCDMIHHVQY